MKPKKLTAEELNREYQWIQDAFGLWPGKLYGHIAALEAEIAQGVKDYDKQTDRLNTEIRLRVRLEAEIARKDTALLAVRHPGISMVEVRNIIDAAMQAGEEKSVRITCEICTNEVKEYGDWCDSCLSDAKRQDGVK